MMETLRNPTTRDRPTVGRLMCWLACVCVILGLAGSLIRLRPFWHTVGNAVHLVLIGALLYIPVLPALVVWQMGKGGCRGHRNRRVVGILVLSFLAWIGAVFLSFRSLLNSIGI